MKVGLLWIPTPNDETLRPSMQNFSSFRPALFGRLSESEAEELALADLFDLDSEHILGDQTEERRYGLRLKTERPAQIDELLVERGQSLGLINNEDLRPGFCHPDDLMEALGFIIEKIDTAHMKDDIKRIINKRQFLCASLKKVHA
jgi:hypothetical protein